MEVPSSSSSQPATPPVGDQRRWFRRKRFRIPLYLVAIATALTLAIGYAVFTKAMVRAGGRDHSRDEWRAIYERDASQVVEWSRQLADATADLVKVAKATTDDLNQPLGVAETARVKQRWAQVFELTQSLSQRADFHRDFVLWVRSEERPDHIRAFLLCDAADLAVNDSGLRLALAMGGKARWERILNEAHDTMGIPSGTFDDFKQSIVSPERTGRQFAARQYLKVLRQSSSFASTTSEPLTGKLYAHCVAAHEEVEHRIDTLGLGLAVNQTKDISGDMAFKAWFPVQKSVANEMGEMRMIEKGKYLVTLEQIEQMRTKMEPGDMVVARKNGYLSNAGIPGFWPHAELYVGRPDELAKFFEDAKVTEWCMAQPEKAKDLPALLEARFPKAWAAFTKPDPALFDLHDEHAEPPAWKNAILEAIAQGVVFRPLEVSIKADYVAVLRPRLDKLARAEALVRAFSHQGKPYDYNFDFVTENALVCSELVWRAYQPDGAFAGVKMPTTELMGRPACTPNDMVRKFDLEWGSPTQELDFVGFLDAREEAGAATWGTMEDFRKTWLKPKMTTLLKM